MAVAATKRPPKSGRKKPTSSRGASMPPWAEVLTLPEAAAFLRLEESQIERLATSQGLPGRRVDDEWRFLKSALEDWLGRPTPLSGKEALLAMAGKWRDDPTLEPMIAEIYRRRRESTLEDNP